MIALLVPLSVLLAFGVLGAVIVYRWLSAPSTGIRRAQRAGIASPYRMPGRRPYMAPELRTIGSRRQVAALAEMGNDWRGPADEPRVIPSPLPVSDQLVRDFADEVDRRIPSRPYARPVRVPDEQTRKVRT